MYNHIIRYLLQLKSQERRLFHVYIKLLQMLILRYRLYCCPELKSSCISSLFSVCVNLTMWIFRKKLQECLGLVTIAARRILNTAPEYKTNCLMVMNRD
ncbi:hypothetical protein GDO81_022384 [Engystomops pustulosus]|uniref:Uncharacterized protein n=1 Tax=Engystomops pustulosus TaxID=76066 RepID=A0AAV6ZB64_ENGPU|nr:hypothetical protein GDO81_022384 [Engystomops pustulosus]